MYSKKEILCTLKSNKEKVCAFFDPNEGFKLKGRPNAKLKKLKYIGSYKISDVDEKYLEMLKQNPITLKLEYSQMDYFILLSPIPRNKLNLLNGMKCSPEKGFFDDTSTLNVSVEY